MKFLVFNLINWWIFFGFVSGSLGIITLMTQKQSDAKVVNPIEDCRRIIHYIVVSTIPVVNVYFAIKWAKELSQQLFQSILKCKFGDNY